jgi:hypothetical protein
MKNMFSIGLGLLILTSGVSVSASSCGDGDHSHLSKEKMAIMAMQIFEKADANSDGFITSDEHTDELAKYGTKFSAYDTNKDERISKKEYMATFNKHHSDGSRGA